MRELSKLLVILTLKFLALLPHGISWELDMPGGLKLITEDKILSFTTDVCPGGVFFKKPIYISYTCAHGYFFRRPNGCRMSQSDIIGGEDYSCQGTTVGYNQKVQAFIPITNSDAPLDHTIAFYDDEDSLNNLRRFTYVKGLEEQYEENKMEAMGITIVNPRRIPPINIGGLCYEGKSQASNTAFIANVELPHSNETFTKNCRSGSKFFPWATARQFQLTKGYSPEIAFKSEEIALLSKITKDGSHRDFSRIEIWNGLALCLQDQTREVRAGKISVGAIYPSLASLGHHCAQYQDMAKEFHVGKTRSKRYAGPHIPCLLKCMRVTLGQLNGDIVGSVKVDPKA